MPYRQRTPLTLATPAIPPLALAAHNTVLLIQDMQYSLVDPQYGLGRTSTQRGVILEFTEYYQPMPTVIGNIQELREAARTQGLPVVYTRFCQAVHCPPSSLQRALGLVAAAADPETAIVGPLTPAEGEQVLVRSGLNAFHATALDQYLREWGAVNLIISGVITEFGIRATAASAQDRGFQPLVVADATSAMTQATQIRTQQEIAYGLTKVRSTGEIIAHLRDMGDLGVVVV